MSAHGGEAIQFFGWAFHFPVDPGKRAAAIFATAHDLIPPSLFYVLIFASIGAVLKHHFVDARNNDVRRMLT